MKKTIIPILILIYVMQIASAGWDMCEDRREIHINCTMVTPHTICGTYNYFVYNLSGDVAQSGDLTQINESIYYFNFTVGEGDYVIRLCDNTTREVRVTDAGDNMLVAAIIIAPLIIGILLMLGSYFLGDEHSAVKIFLFIFSFVMFIPSMHFAVVAISKFYNWQEMSDAIGTTMYWFGLILGVLIFYFTLYLAIKVISHLMNKKKERLEY